MASISTAAIVDRLIYNSETTFSADDARVTIGHFAALIVALETHTREPANGN
jgi:hypothetical protein